MAEEKYIPGDDEIRELEELAESALLNINELVTIHSQKHHGDRAVISRKQVYKYASVMACNHQIASLLGIDKNTLVKNFSRELKMGRAFAKQKLITRFYHLAVYGNNPADRIFALKNWAGLSDQGLTEELEEMEEGVEFVVRRPVKAIEKLIPSEEQLEVTENIPAEDSIDEEA